MCLEQNLFVLSNKIIMYYDKNIKKDIRILPADNIHKRNRKGAHIQQDQRKFHKAILQIHNKIFFSRILTTQSYYLQKSKIRLKDNKYFFVIWHKSC